MWRLLLSSLSSFMRPHRLWAAVMMEEYSAFHSESLNKDVLLTQPLAVGGMEGWMEGWMEGGRMLPVDAALALRGSVPPSWTGATRLAVARRSDSPANTLPVERLQWTTPNPSCFNLSLYSWLKSGSVETLSLHWKVSAAYLIITELQKNCRSKRRRQILTLSANRSVRRRRPPTVLQHTAPPLQLRHPENPPLQHKMSSKFPDWKRILPLVVSLPPPLGSAHCSRI